MHSCCAFTPYSDAQQNQRGCGSHSGIAEILIFYEGLIWTHRGLSYYFNKVERNKQQAKTISKNESVFWTFLCSEEKILKISLESV